jgi:lipid II:glycine glycyltransferase (peptidoglycan interpeptide bridge formation enzyme)
VLPYQTIWLDLRQAPEMLRARLKSNWRNKLNKAERAALRVEWDKPEEGLSWLLQHHQAHRTMKNFQAASPRFIRMLARYFHPRGDMLVGRAFHGREAVAGVLFFRHGRSATYQVGWSGEEGRNVNAHQLLLWQGMLQLQAAGVSDLDLGGINDQAEGVRTFKEGLGGETVTLGALYT